MFLGSNNDNREQIADDVRSETISLMTVDSDSIKGQSQTSDSCNQNEYDVQSETISYSTVDSDSVPGN